jgi:hypothetical protein
MEKASFDAVVARSTSRPGLLTLRIYSEAKGRLAATSVVEAETEAFAKINAVPGSRVKITVELLEADGD